jgi:hypothetical protein
VIHPRIPKDLESLGVTNILWGRDTIQIRAGQGWVDLSGSVLRTAGRQFRIRFAPSGKGEPRVTRNGEPFDSFRISEDGALEVTVTGLDPGKYEVGWSEENAVETGEVRPATGQ